MKFQQTIANELEICGQALHSGAMVKMHILPLPPNSGIYFSRPDLPGNPQVKADVNSVVDTKKSVTIGKDGWRVSTIEHLMAVFHGLGIDNALVEVEGEELPLGDAGDGSALSFANRILKVGLVNQNEPRHYTYIREPIWVEGIVHKQDEPLKSMLIALPADELQISFTFTSDHKTTGTQYFHYSLSDESFLKEIAPARTIAFMREIEYLRAQGLARSNDFNIAVIVSENGYQNELRFPEEIVRHKILDLIGDLYLAGPLVGHIIAIRSGHSLDWELGKKIFQQSLKMVR